MCYNGMDDKYYLYYRRVSPQGGEAVINTVNNMTLLIKRQGDQRETRP